MNLEKEREMQENMDIIRQNLPKEVQLPPALQGQYLLQRAQVQERKAPVLWKKWAVAACSLMFIAMVGVGMMPQSQNKDINRMAQKAAPMAYSAAPAECAAEESAAAVEMNVGIRTHTAAGEDALDVLKELYPGVQVFSFNDAAKKYTVFSFHGEESHYLAFLGATVGYDIIDGEIVITELDSGKTMRFDAATFEQLK